MLLFRIFPLLIILTIVMALDSPLKNLKDDPEFGKTPEIEIFTHQDCSNMTSDQMSMVLSYYPYVKVRCEAELSTLIPTELQVLDNIEDVNGEELESRGKSHTYYFNEILPILEANSSRTRFPISPCVRSVGPLGRGAYELSFSLRLFLFGMTRLTRSLPFFSSLGMLKGNMATEGEATYSVLCAYRDQRVRPVVEFNTVKTKEKVRQWIVDLHRKPFVKYTEWEPLARERIIEDTLMFSCISEKNVTDICTWNDQEAVDKLTDINLRPAPSKTIPDDSDWEEL